MVQPADALLTERVFANIPGMLLIACIFEHMGWSLWQKAATLGMTGTER